MDKYLILDKNNKISSFNDIDSLISYGESLSNIFMKISNDEMIDIIAYYFVEVETTFICINRDSITIFLVDRIDSSRINTIREIINNLDLHLIIKYNLDMSLGIINCKEIISNKNNKNEAIDFLRKN